MKHRTKRAGMAALLAACAMLSGCMTRELKTGLSEQDAQEIAVLLQQNGLETKLVRESSGDRNATPHWTLRVKGGDHNLVTAWRILQENGLPRQKVSGLEEVFSTHGMIPTPAEEKARMLLALSGELTRTLKSVSGVVDARVQIVLPENSPLVDKAQWSPPTASVLLKHRGAQTPLSEDEVRRLVSRGVEGLQPDNVAVVFKPVGAPTGRAVVNSDWFLSDADILFAALALMVTASLAGLVLAVRCRQQRVAISGLKNQLDAAVSRTPLAAAQAGKG